MQATKKLRLYSVFKQCSAKCKEVKHTRGLMLCQASSEELYDRSQSLSALDLRLVKCTLNQNISEHKTFQNNYKPRTTHVDFFKLGNLLSSESCHVIQGCGQTGWPKAETQTMDPVLKLGHSRFAEIRPAMWNAWNTGARTESHLAEVSPCAQIRYKLL